MEVLITLIELATCNLMLVIPLLICLITFLVRLPYLSRIESFNYSCDAKTKYGSKDHTYRFFVKRVDGSYRCYIEGTPSFRGRDTSHYMPHYWVEQGTERHYICWTGKIKHPEQAKTLCRNWSDATQQFIDTGVPAPGFRGE